MAAIEVEVPIERHRTGPSERLILAAYHLMNASTSDRGETHTALRRELRAAKPVEGKP